MSFCARTTASRASRRSALDTQAAASCTIGRRVVGGAAERESPPAKRAPSRGPYTPYRRRVSSSPRHWCGRGDGRVDTRSCPSTIACVKLRTERVSTCYRLAADNGGSMREQCRKKVERKPCRRSGWARGACILGRRTTRPITSTGVTRLPARLRMSRTRAVMQETRPGSRRSASSFTARALAQRRQ